MALSIENKFLLSLLWARTKDMNCAEIKLLGGHAGSEDDS